MYPTYKTSIVLRIGNFPDLEWEGEVPFVPQKGMVFLLPFRKIFTKTFKVRITKVMWNSTGGPEQPVFWLDAELESTDEYGLRDLSDEEIYDALSEEWW